MEIKRIASAIRKNRRRTPAERKLRHRRILFRMSDENVSESAKDIDRLSGWAWSLADPDRLVNKLGRLPDSFRDIVEVGYSIIVSAVIFVPILILKFFLYVDLIVNSVMAFTYHPSRPALGRPSEFIKNANAGAKLSEGGKKSAVSEAKLELTRERQKRDDALREEAMRLKILGRAKHEIAGILAQKYCGVSGYPTSTKQYRNIIKPIFE